MSAARNKSTRRRASSKTSTIELQNQDKFQKQKRVKKSSLNDEEVEIEDAHCSSSVGTLTALLPLPDVAASSSEQVTPEQVDNAAHLASSVFCRPAGSSSAAGLGAGPGRLVKVNRRSSVDLMTDKAVLLNSKVPTKQSLTNKSLAAAKPSTSSKAKVRSTRSYQIKKPIDIKKCAWTNTVQPWIVADPPERAPFDVSFKDKPADEAFSEDACRIIINLYDFFKQLGFVDPVQETLNATRITSKQFLKIRSDLTQASHDHHY